MKTKTRKSAVKRFKLTGTGKLLRKRQGGAHLLRKKSRTQRDRLTSITVVDSSYKEHIKKLLPNL